MLSVKRISVLLALSAVLVVAMLAPTYAAVNIFSNRTAFEAASYGLLTQGFEGECWDAPNGAYPPGFGWIGWYVTYGYNETPPYYMPAPIPAAAGLPTTDVVTVGAYQQDQRVLRVMSEQYGTNYGSGQYVQWDKYGAVPDPDDQDFLKIGLVPGKGAVGMDFMGGATLEVKVFSGSLLLTTLGVTVDPVSSFVGFTSPTDLITNLEVRITSANGSSNMDNLTWGSAVPEPSSLLALGAGLSGIALSLRRRVRT